MSADLIIQSGTKLALHQWLVARGFGTLGDAPDYDYTHTDPGSVFYWWNHPSGVVTASINNANPANPVATNYTGFFGLLKIKGDIPANLQTWASSFAVVVSAQGLSGVGGEGIVIFDPEDMRAAVEAGGAPLWDGLLGVSNQWSDPALWAFSAVMTGDQRDFDGTTYESLIDFNVWSPTQYPAGWQEVEATEPEVQPWVQPTGAQDAYPLGAIVTHNGQTWENTGSPANVWAPGVFGWTVV
jgi:hypothetical protein